MALLFLGDFFYSYSTMAEDILEISKFIRRNNFQVVLNLEGPITHSNYKIKKRGEHLRQSDCALEVLNALNVVGVSLANNHIMDFGEAGLVETINVLQQNNIQYSGAGLSTEEASRPLIIEDEGFLYKVYCMTDSYEESVIAKKNRCGCAPIEIKKFEKNDNEVAVAFLHTGFEYNTLPMPRNIREAKKLIDSGADVVIGSHPHLIQPKLDYKGCPVYFSIGNFYFSEFREEFNSKRIKNKDGGFCNIGYGILLGKNVACFKFEYLSKGQNTVIEETCCVPDINKSKVNLQYLKKCYLNRNNHNPILLGFKIHDDVAIKALDFLYWLYGLWNRSR